ncbi:MAG: FAD-binding oxidoreductase [Dehalococcoidia bacterium]|nr:FAD-binding oxidoreductase [Dehalococcoidia bacterium]
MSVRDEFIPDWCEQEAPDHSFRSLFKYGDPRGFKHPNQGMFRLLKEVFGMTDADFKKPVLCMEDFDIQIPTALPAEYVKAISAIAGEDNVSIDTYSRVRASYGGGMIDALRLRNGIVENLPDIVAGPRDRADVESIVKYCREKRIPLYVAGGNSSVTRGKEAVKGGICLDMCAHMNRVLSINEINQTVTVQPGIMGPELERILNNAPQIMKTRHSYTAGHFPQSFEHSSVGGWVVTRGAGQNSTYYGKIEDIVIDQEYVTPVGIFKTLPFPRSATGPDFDQIMIGSEGTFGVLTSVTLRLSRYMPENRRRYAFLFKSWESALAACREVMQAESGLPSVFRISDPEETDVAMRMYHVHGTPIDSLLRRLGYHPMKRCILLGTADGDRGFARLVAGKVRDICRRKGAFDLTIAKVTQSWEKSRFSDPFMREDLMDYGILIDTLECAVTWDNLPEVHEKVRAIIKSRPGTICMTHLSHAYPQGGNLYFIFVARMSGINEYLALQYSILEAIFKAGAAMSHHHGIGKQTAPWLEEQIGKPAMDVIRVLRNHFDPEHIMNPGGTLGLDMSEEQMKKRWGFIN